MPHSSNLSKAAILADIATSDRTITQSQLNSFLPEQMSLTIDDLKGKLSGKILATDDENTAMIN